MRTIDNNSIRLEAENKQSQLNKTPTPAEVQANLAKQGMKTAILGEDLNGPFNSKEDYANWHGGEVAPSAEVRDWEERMASDEAVDASEKNNLVPFDDIREDTHESTLEGFTVRDASQGELNEGIDEVPEELEGELGEPDDDEVKA